MFVYQRAVRGEASNHPTVMTHNWLAEDTKTLLQY